MKHVAARLHAFAYGLFKPHPRAVALDAYREVQTALTNNNLSTSLERKALASSLMGDVLALGTPPSSSEFRRVALLYAEAAFAFEGLFELPPFDWDKTHSIAEYWELQDSLKRQRVFVSNIEETKSHIRDVFWRTVTALQAALPISPEHTDAANSIIVPIDLIHATAQLPQVVEALCGASFDEDAVNLGLFDRHRQRLDTNLIAASGGNPNDRKEFTKTLRYPEQSDIKEPEKLVSTYLGGTPLIGLFRQTVDFAIPEDVRFEHMHIVAGSGHGKTQTLQYLIAEDLEAVARGERSIVVIDSQGDLIRRISYLKCFAKGEPLHERVVLIDPTDVEWPVSLNLFDVGLKRLDGYSKLNRERLTNSILELYDFVLGSLLSAEMTQKQNVIFRYVTRLMLQIPNATIHTLRDLMEPKSEVKFAASIDQLSGSARDFFRTEFSSSEFTQTRKQVLRRLWGILENQTFERMFSHPRSKLDLFAEMNAGKVILINTAKDLLKETGTEIFGRFFIALIAQAAQERATLKEHDRKPTMVYVDEAADYFDRNIGIIAQSARKYNVGLVLAHQFLGQLEPKLQEALSANTSIKFAGGVSNKDARALAPMMSCQPELIEAQSKGSFAAFVRGVTKSALPLKFPFGRMENMERMTDAEFTQFRNAMRAKYAVHISEFEGDEEEATGSPKTESNKLKPAVYDDTPDSEW